jgi:hypothetical protein
MKGEPQIPADGVGNDPNNAIRASSEPNMDLDNKDVSHVERVFSTEAKPEKVDLDYSRMDKEVQEYALRGQLDIDDAESRRLRRRVDRRVLVVMIITYFLQALDKGTLSFASIMGLREQLGLMDSQKVELSQTALEQR